VGHWWQRFRAQFLGAGPENQIAQIYHITAILALMGSLIGGLWAFGEYIWPERPVPVPLHSTPTLEEQPTTRSALSIVVLPFVNLSGDPA
jgi:hypothetical protein